MLTERVIWVLRDREKARKYRLLPPNGMLLYGPPGCGKTYFAEKNAGAAETGTGRPKNRTHTPPFFGFTT